MAKTPATNADEQLLTSPQAAVIAGLNRVHFARLIRDGKGPKFARLGPRIIVIRRADLDAWLANRSK